MRLQAELKRELGAAPTIRWGRLGQLDVVVDGAIVFSKQNTGRLPEPGEVARLASTRR